MFLTFHKTLATTLAFASITFATFSTLASLPLSRNDSPVFRTANVAERPSGAGIAITGQKPRPRLTWFKVLLVHQIGFVQVLIRSALFFHV